MSATLHNLNIGPFIISAGLRKDGGRSVEIKSDIREGGAVVATLITPGPIVVVFHRPTLDALAAQLDNVERGDGCYEADDTCDGDIGPATILGWTWDDDGERREATEVPLCLHHMVGMAATEGEVTRFLAGDEDWQQAVS